MDRTGYMGAGLHRMAAAGLSLACGLWAGHAHAVPTLDGHDVTAAAGQSVDLVDFHLGFLARQAAADSPLAYAGTNTRWAPMRFKLNDGQEVGGNLARFQINMGLGLGSLDTFAFFAGANYDIVQAVGPGGTWIENLEPGFGGEVYGFIGMAIWHVQVTWGKLERLEQPRDPWGGYMAGASDGPASFRAGTPDALATPDGGSTLNVLSAYEDRSGAFLAAVWEQYVTDTYETQRRLTELRLNLQPLQGLGEGLVSSYGIPSVGLRRFHGLRSLTDAPEGPGAEAPNPNFVSESDIPAASYEVETGADDVLAGGLRWRTAVRVAPSVALNRFEAGYVDEHELAGRWTIRLGAQATAWRHRGDMRVGAEAYALMGHWSSILKWPLPVQFGASYSYNTPDTSTFLPISNAHVFGVTAVAGYPETTRELVPLVRTIDERKRVATSRGDGQ